MSRALHFGAQDLGQEPGLGRTDLREPLRHRGDGAVVLGEDRDTLIHRRFRHVALLRQGPGNHAQPLGRRHALQLALHPPGQLFEVGGEQSHRRLTPFSRHHRAEHGGERLAVPPGEQLLPCGTEPVGEDRRPDPTMLPLISDQAFELQLFQMMPGSIQRDPKPDGQLPGGQRLSPLELGEDRTALALVSDWNVGFDQRKRGSHYGGNVK